MYALGDFGSFHAGGRIMTVSGQVLRQRYADGSRDEFLHRTSANPIPCNEFGSYADPHASVPSTRRCRSARRVLPLPLSLWSMTISRMLFADAKKMVEEIVKAIQVGWSGMLHRWSGGDWRNGVACPSGEGCHPRPCGSTRLRMRFAPKPHRGRPRWRSWRSPSLRRINRRIPAGIVRLLVPLRHNPPLTLVIPHPLDHRSTVPVHQPQPHQVALQVRLVVVLERGCGCAAPRSCRTGPPRRVRAGSSP